MNGPVVLSRGASAFCWLAAILICPFFWCLYAGCIVVRLICYCMGTLCGSWESILGMEAVFAHEMTSAKGVVNSIFFCAGILQTEDCTRAFDERVVRGVGPDGHLRWPRFSQYLDILFGFPVWCPVKSVDIRQHVYDHPGKPVESEIELEKMVNEYFDKPMAAGRPHFEAIRILLKDGWRSKKHPNDVVPKSCAIIRLHHAIADGLSGSRIICEALSTNYDLMMDQMNAMVKTSQAAETRKALRLRVALATALLVAAGVVLVPLHVVRLFIGRDRGPLRQARTRTGRKHYCWSRALPMSRIKDIKNAVTGCTVNDVVISCVSGAMRRFLQSDPMGTGNVVPSRLMINMPVSVQRLDLPVRNYNSLLMLRTALVTGTGDSLDRLLTCKSEMDGLKASPLRCLTDDFMAYWTGSSFCQKLCKFGLNLISPCLVYSNIPGPPIRINFLGKEIIDFVGCVPNLSSHGLSIAAMTYSDHITFSVVMDKGISEDIEVARGIIKGVEEQLDLLEKAIFMGLPTQATGLIVKTTQLIDEKCKDTNGLDKKLRFGVSDIVKKHPLRVAKVDLPTKG